MRRFMHPLKEVKMQMDCVIIEDRSSDYVVYCDWKKELCTATDEYEWCPVARRIECVGRTNQNIHLIGYVWFFSERQSLMIDFAAHFYL